MRPHIERWLGVERGARAERRLAHQAEYDLRQAEHSRKRKLAKVKHIGPQPAQWRTRVVPTVLRGNTHICAAGRAGGSRGFTPQRIQNPRPARSIDTTPTALRSGDSSVKFGSASRG